MVVSMLCEFVDRPDIDLEHALLALCMQLGIDVASYPADCDDKAYGVKFGRIRDLLRWLSVFGHCGSFSLYLPMMISLVHNPWLSSVMLLGRFLWVDSESIVPCHRPNNIRPDLGCMNNSIGTFPCNILRCHLPGDPDIRCGFCLMTGVLIGDGVNWC